MTALLANPFRTAWILFRRDLIRLLASPGLYILIGLLALGATAVLQNLLGTFATESVLVSAAPAGGVLAGAIAIAALLAAIHGATAISGEQEHGTLEVLFAGPVTPFGFVLAKFARSLAVYVLVAAALLVQLSIAGLATNLRLGLHTALDTAASIVLAAPSIGVALGLSGLCRRARTSVVLLTVLFALLILLHVGTLWLAALDPVDTSLFVFYLREAGLRLEPVAAWLSPVDYVVAAARQLAAPSLAPISPRLAAAALYAIIALAAATLILRRKGSSA